jgi:deoxycytidylate deaminase
MTVARDPFTATRLNDGTILIAGGCGTAFCGTTLASAELSDAAGQTFSAITSPMSNPRSYHTATLLNNGKVLIAGGYSDRSATPSASADLYDPATQTFTPTGPLLTARGAHTATLLQDGTVLIAGGADSCPKPVTGAPELYDPSTGTFTVVGGLATARYAHTATLLDDGRVLLAGGATDCNGTPTNTAELYNPASRSFNSIANMTSPRAFQTATRLNDGTVLLAGGSTAVSNFAPQLTTSAEVYYPATQSFSGTGGMSTARGAHTATLLNDGTVLVTGGGGIVDGTFNLNRAGSPTATVEFYDPNSGGFSSASSISMNTPRSLHTATLLNNGTVLIAGGDMDANGTPTNSAELFLPGFATPVSLAVTPASSTASPGATQRFIATGTFSDSSTHQLASAIWSTSDSRWRYRRGKQQSPPGRASSAGQRP